MFIISKNASSPHSTPLDDGLRAMRHPLAFRLTTLPYHLTTPTFQFRVKKLYTRRCHGRASTRRPSTLKGVGGFAALVTRLYYHSQRRAPLGTQ
ncbi:hypothetical protein EV121DRAFT_298160 [Schizophyllum commune]